MASSPFVAETDLTDITGVRLEVLTDSRFPSKGPGRAPDGNFVLTELELAAAPKADPKKTAPVKLQSPLADFSQVELRSRQGRRRQSQRRRRRLGRLARQRASSTGRRLRPSDPVGKPGGTILTFQLHHKFVGQCLHHRPVPPVRDPRARGRSGWASRKSSGPTSRPSPSCDPRHSGIAC